MADPRELAHRWLEQIWTHGNLDVVDELMHPDAELQGMGNHRGVSTTPAEVKAIAQRTLAGFPHERRLTILETLVEGDRVMTRFRFEARHDGPYFGIPATGKLVDVQGFGYGEFRDGKLYRAYNVADFVTALQQLGVLDPAEHGVD